MNQKCVNNTNDLGDTIDKEIKRLYVAKPPVWETWTVMVLGAIGIACGYGALISTYRILTWDRSFEFGEVIVWSIIGITFLVLEFVWIRYNIRSLPQS